MTLSHTLQGNNFSGLVGVLAAASGSGNNFEVVADIEGEQETMPAHAKVDDDDDLDDDDSPSHGDRHENPIGRLPAQWKETMAQAARGVTENTHREYIRYVFLTYSLSSY